MSYILKPTAKGTTEMNLGRHPESKLQRQQAYGWRDILVQTWRAVRAYNFFISFCRKGDSRNLVNQPQRIEPPQNTVTQWGPSMPALGRMANWGIWDWEVPVRGSSTNGASRQAKLYHPAPLCLHSRVASFLKFGRDTSSKNKVGQGRFHGPFSLGLTSLAFPAFRKKGAWWEGSRVPIHMRTPLNNNGQGKEL